MRVEKREEAYAIASEGDAWWREHQPKEPMTRPFTPENFTGEATANGGGGGIGLPHVGDSGRITKQSAWRS